MVSFIGKIPRRIAFSFFSLMAVLSILFCMYAIVSPKWYGAESNRAASGTDARIAGGHAVGPWYACGRENEVWFCSEVILSGLGPNGPTCAARSESKITSGFFAIRALVILTGAFMAVAAVLASGISAMGPSYAKYGTIALIVFSGLAVLANVAGIIAAHIFFQKTLLCDDGFCYLVKANDPTVDCKEKFYHAAYVYFVGIIFPLFALFAAIFLLVTAPTTVVAKAPKATAYDYPNNNKIASPGPYEEQPTEMYPQYDNNDYSHTTHPTHNNREIDSYNAVNNSNANINNNDTNEDGAVTFQPPEGDWEWDPNSNMYWSESSYLFLNPNDGHFFDPNSNQWYNPETEEWYSTN